MNRRADPIEAYVEEQVIGYFTGPGRQALDVSGAASVDLTEVRAEAIALRARLRGLAADYADGVLDREGVRVAGDRIRARLGELDVIVAAAGRVDVTASLRAAEDPEEVWDGMGMSSQREVLRRIMDVHVLPGRSGQPGGVRFQEDTVSVTWRRG